MKDAPETFLPLWEKDMIQKKKEKKTMQEITFFEII